MIIYHHHYHHSGFSPILKEFLRNIPLPQRSSTWSPAWPWRNRVGTLTKYTGGADRGPRMLHHRGPGSTPLRTLQWLRITWECGKPLSSAIFHVRANQETKCATSLQWFSKRSPLWPWKVGPITKPEDKRCILARQYKTFHENSTKISRNCDLLHVMFFHFTVAKPRTILERNLVQSRVHVDQVLSPDLKRLWNVPANICRQWPKKVHRWMDG